VDETEERALAPLAAALERALDLLRLGRDGSRISLVRACVRSDLPPSFLYLPAYAAAGSGS
jgi:hypothetical protein